MKQIYPIIFLAALTGCASSGKHDVFQGRDHLPVQNERIFDGHTAKTVRQKLGEPLTIYQEADNTLWTYRKGSCTVFIYLDDDGDVVYSETRGHCDKFKNLLLNK